MFFSWFGKKKVSMAFYRKPHQNPTMGSFISNTLCSATYNIHNTVCIQYIKEHNILGKKSPQKLSSYLNLMKFGLEVAN